ncbi:MAG: hypothetical protein QF805_29350, partial [Pirellulaceae bacterium]|nr:hypothetical protein [Pirellulaceae bacterium]
KNKIELYNLSKDPGESKNLISQHGDVAAALKEKITAIVCRGRTTPGAPQPNDTGHWRDLTWIEPAEFSRRSSGGEP